MANRARAHLRLGGNNAGAWARRGSVLRWLAPSVLVVSLACTPAALPAPSPSPPRAAPIDVDEADSRAMARAQLWAIDGTLMATVGDADDTIDGTRCDASDCELRAHASWARGETVLAATSFDASSDGTPGGWIGSVLPLGAGTAVAVRSWSIDWAETGLGERDDELIELSLTDLSMRTIHAPGGRLRLLAVVGDRALVLVSSRDGSHYVSAIDARRGEVARSEVLRVPEEALAHTYTELGLPWAAPLDARTLALPCTDDGELCSASYDGTSLSLTRLSVSIEEGLELTSDGPVIVRGDECRALAPESAFGPCGELADGEDGLPVDGTLVAGAMAELPLTTLRNTVTLAREESRSIEPPGAGVLVLAAPTTGPDVAFDLLVRADHLAISYTRVSHTTAGTTRRDLGLALPRGSVEARPIELEGRAAHHVRIRTTFPIHYSHACWQGMWVIRAWSDDGSESFANTYAEYGFCE